MRFAREAASSPGRKPVAFALMVTVTVSLAGCGVGTSQEQAEEIVSSNPYVKATEMAEGITYDEAQRKNLLAADGDALIATHQVSYSGNDQILATVTVNNVSRKADTYTLFVSTGEAGQFGTSQTTIEAESSGTITAVIPDVTNPPGGNPLEVTLRLDGFLLGQGVDVEKVTLN